MSFWSDASPVVKGAIVFGVVAGLYLLAARIAGFAPFVPDEQRATQRGIGAPAE
jgi:hypothetical protein